MKILSMSFMLVLVLSSISLAQPPRTRPEAGEITRPNNGTARPDNDDTSKTEAIQVPRDWPHDRKPGQRRTEGQRSTRAEAPSTYRVPANIPQVSRNWYMGINAERSPRGLRITQVVGGSPAQRFGLEVGDYILDVGGYVVGEYDKKSIRYRWPWTTVPTQVAGPKSLCGTNERSAKN